jgi:hypothetical protein
VCWPRRCPMIDVTIVPGTCWYHIFSGPAKGLQQVWLSWVMCDVYQRRSRWLWVVHVPQRQLSRLQRLPQSQIHRGLCWPITGISLALIIMAAGVTHIETHGSNTGKNGSGSGILRGTTIENGEYWCYQHTIHPSRLSRVSLQPISHILPQNRLNFTPV